MVVNELNEVLLKYDLQVRKQKLEREKKCSEIIKEYGSYGGFHKNLTYHLIEKSGDSDFPSFYSVYDTIFTIKEEKESYEGFEEVLDFNYDQSLQNKFHSFREVLLFCKSPAQNEVIGGINFSTYYIPELFDKYNVLGTSHLFYIFVKPEYRFIHLGSELLEKARKYSDSLIADWSGLTKPIVTDHLIVFCEQNFPEKMMVSQYWSDNLNSLTDQCDRLIWWHNKGFKRLKLDYIQPSLNLFSEPCTYLSLNAQIDSTENLPSDIILEHIKRIFEISILKGRNLENDSNYKQIENFLKDNTYVSVDNNIDFQKLKRLIYTNSKTQTDPSTLINDLIGNKF